MNHIISGLFAGNAVVGKVSEHTSWSVVAYYEHIVKRALEVNGHSPDLVQTVTGFAEAGQALVTDPAVDKVIFTGSTPIGKLVMKAAAGEHLKPVILELGGKDAMVIRHDCKVGTVLPFAMRGCFQNSGQNCVGVERVFVYESLHDEFLKAAVPKVKALRQGNPLEDDGSGCAAAAAADVDCGSTVMPEQLDIIQELVDDAVQKGAKLLCGGRRSTKGQFFAPTVLAAVTPDMRIYQEEVFGPVMTVIKVPNDDDDTAVRMVNNSRFGLGSSVFSGDQAAGLAVARQIRSGMVCVNDFASHYLVQSLPFGGVKESGFGRFAGIEGLRALCLERAVLVDRIPGVKTSIPPCLDYPIDKNKGPPFTESLMHLFYNESWWAKLKAIFGLIKNG
jgi:acyl-CoA reductase-like NAD-dependent aldehyde dehydrogenase